MDRATVFVKAGDGGGGSAAVRSEPYTPRGGPDGGDGGPGGSVIVRVDPSVFDLAAYADRPHWKAAPGTPGSRSNRTGAAGADLVLPVPDRDRRARTSAVWWPTWSAREPKRWLPGEAAEGGAARRWPRRETGSRSGGAWRAGRGATTRAGASARGRRGLVGLPNAGKSTLLARHQRGKAEDRRLPLHHAHPEPRRGRRRGAVRRGRRTGSDRRSPRRQGSGTRVPAARVPVPRAHLRRGCDRRSGRGPGDGSVRGCRVRRRADNAALAGRGDEGRPLGGLAFDTARRCGRRRLGH